MFEGNGKNKQHLKDPEAIGENYYHFKMIKSGKRQIKSTGSKKKVAKYLKKKKKS
jgi:hypothetical protein